MGPARLAPGAAHRSALAGLALAGLALTGLALTACTVARPEGAPAPATTSATPTASPSTPQARTSPTAAPARFRATVHAAPASRMRASWRRGCPVLLRDLRLLRLRHWGFDGRVHEGELVLHRDAVTDLTEVFRRLFSARFAIERMRLVDVYGADDDRSMAANNTSAFNCRRATGSATRWSQHAYGRAIDINPVQNPWVDGRDIRPPAGRRYVDRSPVRQGMIVRGSVVVGAFARAGWGWGGNFRSVKDWQHFSASGR